MDEVECFILVNSLDQRASDALRGCRPDVQQAVLQRGSVLETHNPSAAVLGRIRDAQNGANPAQMAGFKRPGEGYASAVAPKRPHIAADLAQHVEAFIVANSVDAMAAEAFRGCSPE